MNSKKIIFSVLFLTIGLFGISQEKINWIKINKVEKEMSKKENADKKYFIDCYTDWCGWCKKMDSDTFSDTLIAKLMNHYFVASKFDAEQSEDVTIKDKTYQNPGYNPNAKRKTAHQLALYLLNNRLSFPSFSILDKDFNVITVVPGYYPAAEFEKVIVYIGENYIKDIPFETFSKEYQEKYREDALKKVYSEK
jgi:thioredoxin-related protein